MKIGEREQWLIDNVIDYHKGENGTVSVNVNIIPEDIRQEYYDLCYKLQKQET